jgi:hypothetical protein
VVAGLSRVSIEITRIAATGEWVVAECVSTATVYFDQLERLRQLGSTLTLDDHALELPSA